MRFAVDKNNKRICIDEAASDELYYCQECGEKLVQRRGEIKAHHFAHFPNTKCIDSWHYDETEWHYLIQSLFPSECQEIVMELDGKKHRADVYIKDRKTVVLIQGDRIRQTEFASRNIFFSKLGLNIIWVFDVSIPFENNSIDLLNFDGSTMRKWSRPSRTFENFQIENYKNIEVWFSKRKETEDNNFFRVISSDRYKGFGLIECSHCLNKEELIKYITKGIKTVDRGLLYDRHISIRRTDGKDYFYACPFSNDKFVSTEKCFDCQFCIANDDIDDLNVIKCRGRSKNLDIKGITNILNVERNIEGFVTLVKGTTDDGEVITVNCECSKTALRTLSQLWDLYKPLRYLYCYNVKTKHKFRVFNPGWQKAKSGAIKGNLIYRSSFRKDEIEIFMADEPVWIVYNFIRQNNE